MSAPFYINKQIEFSEKYLPVFDTEKRYVILCGGSNAGKSYYIQQLLLMRFLTIPGYNILCVRKIYHSVGGSVYNLFLRLINEWGIRDRVRIVKYEIECLANKNIIAFGGMQNDEQRENVKSITAPNGDFQAVFMEEATQFDPGDFKEFDRRIRGIVIPNVTKQIFMSFNPVLETNWIKDEFKIELTQDDGWSNRNDVFLLKGTIDDNPWATKEDYEVLDGYEERGDEYSLSVYRYGMWGSLNDDNVIIPYSCFHKAQKNRIENPEGIYKIGCDPARFGDCETVIYFAKGLKFLGQKIMAKSDSFQIRNSILSLVERFRKDKNVELEIKIDAGGGGVGAIDMLISENIENCEVFEIHNNGIPKNPKEYANIATESYFEFAKNVIDMEFLSNEQEMFSQVSSRQYTVKELSGKTGRAKTVRVIEPKEKFVLRYGKSPDKGDAAVLCQYNPPRKKKIWMGFA